MLGRLLAPSPRFVLTIGNEGGLLAHVAAGRVSDVRQAGTDGAGLASLGEALARRPGRPLVVLIDLLEQSYRQESVPKVNRMDRRKVLARRLERAFPDAELKAALERGDDPGQRSSRYLLAAVPPTPEWTQWADFLRTVENPIVALTLLPVEAASMVGQLARRLAPADHQPNPWTIFICRQSTGGVRQIVVNQGELALTRLTPGLGPASPGGLAPTLGSGDPPSPAASIDLAAATQHELRATLGYMTRLGYRADAGLDIIMLGDEDLKRHWADAIPNGARLHMLTAADAATALGLGRVGDADEGTLLCAAWAARRPGPALQLLPPDLRLRLLQEQGLRWASAGLAASALGLAGLAALSLVTGLQLEHEIDWLKAWQTTLQGPVERGGPTDGDNALAVETVRAVLEAEQRLQGDKVDPLEPLRVLRRAMAQDEELVSLGWQADAVDRAGRDADPGTDPAGGQEDDFTLDLVLDLGRAEGPRAAVAAADRFAARLAESFPDRPILIKRQALSILPGESFTGGAGLITGQPAASGAMSAELRVGRRRP